MAYLDYYRRFPEIHWSFLAHMVSRNAGWNMTDLKGSFLPKLLNTKQQNLFFSFIERGNWLIFQDAFPQLLLYEESIKRNKNMFYLLSFFNVSFFMEVIWNDFYQKQDVSLLTKALIINEQSYIESRVVLNTNYQKDLLQSFPFQVQDLFSMNQILFPYEENNDINLTGKTLHHFENLHNRISFGKQLYSILFHDKTHLKKTENWAFTTVHTASRKDYWPSLFNDISEDPPGTPLKAKLIFCKLVPGGKRLFSPPLLYAWSNVDHEQAEMYDWYSNWLIISELKDAPSEGVVNIKEDYCRSLNVIELAVIANQMF